MTNAEDDNEGAARDNDHQCDNEVVSGGTTELASKSQDGDARMPQIVR